MYCTYDDGMQVAIDTNVGKRTVVLVPTDLFYYFFLSLHSVYKTDTNIQRPTTFILKKSYKIVSRPTLFVSVYYKSYTFGIRHYFTVLIYTPVQ